MQIYDRALCTGGTASCFEVQGASFYTRQILNKFQQEILTMENSSHTIKHIDGDIGTYNVKDTIIKENDFFERKEYEVTFDASEEKTLACAACLSFKVFFAIMHYLFFMRLMSLKLHHVTCCNIGERILSELMIYLVTMTKFEFMIQEIVQMNYSIDSLNFLMRFLQVKKGTILPTKF